MNTQEPSPDSSPDTPALGDAEPVWVPGYPWWVRMLAVLHVLSHVFGPVGFFVLMAVAGFLSVRRRGVHETVIGVGTLALACPVFGAIYRGWFERFGRRHWPDSSATASGDQRTE